MVIATGGLSIPKIGATDFGYRIARQFGLRIVPPRPALVPLTFDGESWAPYAQLAGLSLPVAIETGEKKDRIVFHEDLLFTHRGLSGPAVLQISSYWREGQPLRIDLAPGVDVLQELPARQGELAQAHCATNWRPGCPRGWPMPGWLGTRAGNARSTRPRDKALAALAEGLSRWTLVPSGTEGYRKAEVTAGGVDTRDLSSQTMESKQAGLYFIGEAVDVTGLAGRLQLPVGLGQRLCLRSRDGPARDGKTPATAEQAWPHMHRHPRSWGYNVGLCWQTPNGLITTQLGNPAVTAPGPDLPKHPLPAHFGIHSLMTTIRVKENEPFDVALRRFKRTIEKLGLLTELRAREFYEKPTAERKRKKAAAVKRHYKRVRSMQLPKKLY